MARDFWINGESLVSVKGATDTAFPLLSQLGLSASPIQVSFDFKHMDIMVDAWGASQMPADVQVMLAGANISMTLIHFDVQSVELCAQLSMGLNTGAAGTSGAFGQLARAGLRIGNNAQRFAPGWKYLSLNISSPVAARPWRFYNCYLTGTPVSWPLGVEKSVIQLQWRCIPYTQDPYYPGGTNSGSPISGQIGAQNYPLFDRTLDV